ncbi:transglycosylase SLT domain-containing protein [Myxococcota bacterium]|nr:transglycosylase SLT domain-containing protein [Myxococcota bacterium]
MDARSGTADGRARVAAWICAVLTLLAACAPSATAGPETPAGSSGQPNSPPPLPDWPPGAPATLTTLPSPPPLQSRLPPEIADAARRCDGGDAAAIDSLLRARPGGDLTGPRLALLKGICAHAAGRRADAVTDLASALPDAGPLRSAVAWTLGDALLEAGNPEEAVRAFEKVGPSAPYGALAAVGLAEAQLLLGRPDRAVAALEAWRAVAGEPSGPREILARAKALSARGSPGDSRSAWEAALDVWTRFPIHGEAREAGDLLDALAGKVDGPGRDDLAVRVGRAEAFGAALRNDDVVALLSSRVQALKAAGEVGCRGLYALGRALQRERKYGEALPVWESAVGTCGDGDLAVRSTYLLAQARWRSGDKAGARRAYLDLAARFPDHSYADDAVLFAAAVADDSGDHEGAEAELLRLVEGFPDGDMRGPAMWDLAWNRYRRGDVAGAVPMLDRIVAEYPLERDRDLSLRARYWAARARGWPEGVGWTLPEGTSVATAERDASLGALAAIARDAPLSYYGAMAYALVQRHRPELARAVELELDAERRRLRALGALPDEWRVEAAFAQDPRLEAADAWAGLGLTERAARAVRQAADDRVAASGLDGAWGGTLMYAAARLEDLGDWHGSHHTLRLWLKRRHPERATGWGATALRLAYPRAYAEPLAVATEGAAFPPLVFQGLVREESAFQPRVISWAGAIGLSQLMWPTAQATAKRLGLPLASREALKRPEVNLKVGAAYFQSLHDELGGLVPLCVAGYNAGGGAVRRWMRERPGWAMDAFVEEIPYDQTREYVERVLGSWQTYSYLYGPDGPFVPLPLSTAPL